MKDNKPEDNIEITKIEMKEKEFKKLVDLINLNCCVRCEIRLTQVLKEVIVLY